MGRDARGAARRDRRAGSRGRARANGSVAIVVGVVGVVCSLVRGVVGGRKYYGTDREEMWGNTCKDCRHGAQPTFRYYKEYCTKWNFWDVPASGYKGSCFDNGWDFRVSMMARARGESATDPATGPEST